MTTEMEMRHCQQLAKEESLGVNNDNVSNLQ